MTPGELELSDPLPAPKDSRDPREAKAPEHEACTVASIYTASVVRSLHPGKALMHVVCVS